MSWPKYKETSHHLFRQYTDDAEVNHKSVVEFLVSDRASAPHIGIIMITVKELQLRSTLVACLPTIKTRHIPQCKISVLGHKQN